MKRLVLTTAALFGLVAIQSANAADMGMPPMPAKAPIVAPPAVFNWTGFYIGGNAGGGWGYQNSTETDTSFLATTGSLYGVSSYSGSATSSGGLAGGQIGFNYEFPNQWLIGIEADADWANIAGSANGCATYTSGPIAAVGTTAGCATDSGTLNDFGTVRGRLGYAWNNVLLYGTGGWAWGNVSSTHTTTCVGPGCPGTSLMFSGGNASASNSLSGWAAGAGLEWGFLPNWTLRLEYLHLEFDNVATNFTTTTGVTINGAGPFPYTINGHVSSSGGIDTVRVGLNYLFNWGAAPSATRY